MAPTDMRLPAFALKSFRVVRRRLLLSQQTPTLAPVRVPRLLSSLQGPNRSCINGTATVPPFLAQLPPAIPLPPRLLWTTLRSFLSLSSTALVPIPAEAPIWVSLHSRSTLLPSPTL